MFALENDLVFEEALNIQSSHTTAGRGGDGLLVDGIGHVTGGKDAFNRGGSGITWKSPTAHPGVC